jgi:hypothetical protein
MEKPYTGRAIVTDTFLGVEILIPAQKNLGVIIFLGVWLCGWAFGEIFAIITVLGGGTDTDIGVKAFMLVWLFGWTIGGYFAFKMAIWSLIGKEIITVEHGQLTIDKKGAIFYSPKSYDVSDIKALRVQEDVYDSNNRRNTVNGFNNTGTIRFDYGMKTIKFGSGIDEAEAKAIIEKLVSMNLVNEKNLSKEFVANY